MSISLTLPEPARGLFRMVRATLAELLPTVIDSDLGWWLGGGTVLAAQWEHRLSTDLDVFLPAEASLATFDPRWAPDFRDAMLRLGATRMEVQQRSLKTWFPAGRLEITALDPIPALPPRTASIDGSDARLLENASILCGKRYGRGRRMPERDVFDVCVAAIEDPDALRCAVNHVGADTRREIAHLLMIGADAYRESAAETILEPAPRFAGLLEEAPERAAELIRDETWASTDFDYALEGAVTVTARTVGGTVVSRTCGSGEALAAAMLGMGLEEMMLGRHGTMRAFVQEVDGRLG